MSSKHAQTPWAHLGGLVKSSKPPVPQFLDLSHACGTIALRVLQEVHEITFVKGLHKLGRAP